jgi:4-hydroxy-2-oxoheptanedioate aldolase
MLWLRCNRRKLETYGEEIMTRRNAVIQRLINKQTVFSTLPIPNGSFNDFAFFAQSDFDLVMIETEHQGFDSLLLRTSMQYLMNRKRILKDGALISPTPLVRVAPNSREKNEWVIKQTLDAGAMGLVLPHLESVESAEAAIKAARYPRARGAAQNGPDGLRGWSPFVAMDYWGVTQDEYYERADIWPLNPDGEILLMGIVENMTGVKNLPQILKQAKGIGVIWAGSGDLSVSMGLRGEHSHKEVEAEMLKILRICKDHGVACCAPIGAGGVDERIDQGFEVIIIHTMPSLEQLKRGVTRRGV